MYDARIVSGGSRWDWWSINPTVPKIAQAIEVVVDFMVI